MTLEIGRTISRGVSKTTTSAGLSLVALYAVYVVVTTAAANTAVLGSTGTRAPGGVEPGLTLPVSASVAGLVSLVGFVVGAALIVAIARTMVRDERELESIPEDAFGRRIGIATLVAIGAGILAGIAIGIGFVLLFVPGLFLLVSFLFVPFFVAVEDEGVLGSLGRSWGLASGNRFPLLGIVFVLFVLQVGASIVGAIFGFVSPAVGDVVSALLSGVLIVLSMGITADAYLQLGGKRASEETTPTI